MALGYVVESPVHAIQGAAILPASLPPPQNNSGSLRSFMPRPVLLSTAYISADCTFSLSQRSLGSPHWGMAEMEHSLSQGPASGRLQGGINHQQRSSETREAESQVCSRQSWRKRGPGPAAVWARLRGRLLRAQFLSRVETLPQPPSPHNNDEVGSFPFPQVRG